MASKTITTNNNQTTKIAHKPAKIFKHASIISVPSASCLCHLFLIYTARRSNGSKPNGIRINFPLINSLYMLYFISIFGHIDLKICQRHGKPLDQPTSVHGIHSQRDIFSLSRYQHEKRWQSISMANRNSNRKKS